MEDEEISYDDFFKKIASNEKSKFTAGRLKTYDYNSDLGKSKYDKDLNADVQINESDFFNSLSSNRSEVQPASHMIGNAVARLTNVFPGIIGNFASIEDLGDQFTTDFKAGNVITEWAKKLKQDTDEAFPIYRENPGKTLDLGDPAYWVEQGSGLVNSAIEFGISGGILSKGLSGLSKIAKLRQLSNAVAKAPGIAKLGLDGAQIGKGAQILQHATIMNAMEGTLTAADTFDKVYQTQLADYLGQGLSNEEAHTKATADASEGAAATYNANKWAIPLNLISSGMFMKKLPTRGGGAKPGWKADTKAYLGEGVQEYGEETINFLAGNYGEAKGTKKKYGFNEIIKDLGTPEAIESGMLGFLGGVGQTAFTKQAVNRINKTIDPETGEKISIRNYNKKVYNDYKDFTDKLEAVQKDGNISTFTNSFETLTDQIKLKKAYETAVEKGDTEEAKRIAALSVDVQAYDAFTKGATDVLVETYESIRDGEQKEGLPDNYKEKATEAIKKIETLEKFYNESTGYVNQKQVYLNKANRYELENYVEEINTQINEVSTGLNSYLNKISDISDNVKGDVNKTGYFLDINNIDFNPAKEAGDAEAAAELKEIQTLIKASPDYKFLQEAKALKKDAVKQLKESLITYNNITTDAYQEAFKERVANARQSAETEINRNAAKTEAEIKADEAAKAEADRQADIAAKNAENAQAVADKAQAVADTKENLEVVADNYNEGEVLDLENIFGEEYKGISGTVVNVEENADGTRIATIDADNGEFLTTEDAITKPTQDVDTDDVYNTDGSAVENTSNEDSVQESSDKADTDEAIKDSNKLSDVKLMSTYRDSGRPLKGIPEAYLEYETNPVDKIGTKVYFEINKQPDNKSSNKADIEKRRQEEKTVHTDTDKKGRKYTYFETVTEKDGLTKTKFTFNRSDKDSTQRNNASVPTEVALGDKYTIPKETKNADGSMSDQIPENTTVHSVLEIRESGGKVGATVMFQDKDDTTIRWRGDIVLEINAKYDVELDNLNNDKTDNFSKATKIYNDFIANKEISEDDKNFMVDYLPFKAKIDNSDVVYTFLESKPNTTNPKSLETYNNRTRPLRISLIKQLKDGNDISTLYTTVKGQYGGQIQLDDKGTENSILDLNDIDSLDDVDLYVIDGQGQLKDISGDNAKDWYHTKKNWKGSIYMKTKLANGNPFYLNLNFGKVKPKQAEVIFEVYRSLLQKGNRPTSLVTNLSPQIQSLIKKNLKPEIDVIKKTENKPFNEIILSELLDLIFWDGSDKTMSGDKNIKSRLNINYTTKSVEFGDKSYKLNEFTDDKKAEFVDWVSKNKNRNFKFKPKRNDINQALNSTSIDYLQYAIDEKVINTNAKVNQPLFKGFTNVYLTNGISGGVVTKSININTGFNKAIDTNLKYAASVDGKNYYASADSGRVFTSKDLKDINGRTPYVTEQIGELVTDVNLIGKIEINIRGNMFAGAPNITLKKTFKNKAENTRISQNNFVPLQENSLSDESVTKNTKPLVKKAPRKKLSKKELTAKAKAAKEALKHKCNNGGK